MNALITTIEKAPRELHNMPMGPSVAKENISMYEKLCERKAKIGVVGLGYVGLPIALEFANEFDVIGFDIKPERVAMMQQGVDPSEELSSDAFANKYIEYTATTRALEEADFYVVAVPTPVDKHKTPNLTPIKKACESVALTLNKGNIVVFESTVYPGCTEEVCIPILEKYSGLTYNIDFKVGYSPERINPGDKKHTLTKITKIVSGSDAESTEEIRKVYDHIITAGVHVAPSMKVAEAAKIVENTQRDVNIALMNELSTLFNELNINTHDVLAAAGTKWNFLNFYPGLVGGHCIGVDPYYLLHKAEQHDLTLGVIKSSRSINDSMPAQVMERAAVSLSKLGKRLSDSKVLVLGCTFKENVTDLRNSKAAELCQFFQEHARELHIVDPQASEEVLQAHYGLPLHKGMEEDYDLIVYAVNHKEFESIDWDLIDVLRAESAVVVDFKKCLGAPTEGEQVEYITL